MPKHAIYWQLFPVYTTNLVTHPIYKTWLPVALYQPFNKTHTDRRIHLPSSVSSVSLKVHVIKVNWYGRYGTSVSMCVYQMSCNAMLSKEDDRLSVYNMYEGSEWSFSLLYRRSTIATSLSYTAWQSSLVGKINLPKTLITITSYFR